MRCVKPRVAVVVLLSLAIAASCSSEKAPAEFKPECAINQFRACEPSETDACRGVQQCVEPGLWSVCSCVVLDGSFPEAGPDVRDSATEEASEASPETGPETGNDAAEDADFDAGMKSDADAND